MHVAALHSAGLKPSVSVLSSALTDITEAQGTILNREYKAQVLFPTRAYHETTVKVDPLPAAMLKPRAQKSVDIIQ